MFIDLDYFKEINDTLGHDMGDVVIKETAIRLQACIRKMDTVARMGGDEFTVIVTDIKTSKDAELVAKNILKALTEPFELKGKSVSRSTLWMQRTVRHFSNMLMTRCMTPKKNAMPSAYSVIL